MTQSLSHTARSTLFKCPRLFYLRYIKDLQRRTKPSGLRMGIVFSDVLEHWDLTVAQDSYGKMITETTDPTLLKKANNELAVIETLASVYMSKVKQHKRELEFGPYEITKGFSWRGFIDGELEPGTIIENKLLSRWTSTDERALDIDDQVTGYIAAYSKLTGIPADEITMLYHVCLKPGIRIKRDESPEAFCQRFAQTIEAAPDKFFKSYRQTRTVKQVDEFMHSLEFAAQYIEFLAERDRYDMNNTACKLYGECEMLPLCSAKSSEDAVAALDLYVKREDT